MDLRKKLAGLRDAGPGSKPVEPRAPEAAATRVTAESTDAARKARIDELRGRIHSLTMRPTVHPVSRLSARERDAVLPFVVDEGAHGPVHRRVRVYESTQRHGRVSLHRALDARGDALASLALDPALRDIDPAAALYLDTETTGLSGGTGTLAFLVGAARFEGRRMHVEQWFLAEPGAERGMLAQLAERIESASAIVSFNGKAFDMPLLRARYVMSRMTAPREPPHFDLVHAARRVYGARLDECRLTTLERDVLGFVRVDDVPSGEIPARYVQYLQTGDPTGLLAVIEHNLWDVIAMAALLGELAARLDGSEAEGSFEPSDMAGLARAAFRAKVPARALQLAHEAAQQGAARGEREIATRAHTLTAKIHRTHRDHEAAAEALLRALEHTPNDASLHLALAKLYEHRLRDLTRAVFHAERADDAETEAQHGRRIARLMRRLAKRPLRLPGVDCGVPRGTTP